MAFALRSRRRRGLDRGFFLFWLENFIFLLVLLDYFWSWPQKDSKTRTRSVLRTHTRLVLANSGLDSSSACELAFWNWQRRTGLSPPPVLSMSNLAFYSALTSGRRVILFISFWKVADARSWPRLVKLHLLLFLSSLLLTLVAVSHLTRSALDPNVPGGGEQHKKEKDNCPALHSSPSLLTKERKEEEGLSSADGEVYFPHRPTFNFPTPPL